MPKLSDTKIRNSKRRTKPYKFYDSNVLFLIIKPGGTKWWRQRYRYAGREQLISLGVYDEVSLADAHERSSAIRKLIARDVDPSAQRREHKAALVDAKSNTFKGAALAWHG